MAAPEDFVLPHQLPAWVKTSIPLAGCFSIGWSDAASHRKGLRLYRRDSGAWSRSELTAYDEGWDAYTTENKKGAQ